MQLAYVRLSRGTNGKQLLENRKDVWDVGETKSDPTTGFSLYKQMGSEES
jgi:hypothetical protein